MSAVVCEGISMAFPSGAGMQAVLHDVNVAVEAGQLTLLVGPSGCGKTTLISIMTSILTPTKGHVRVWGTDVTHLKGAAQVLFRRREIGFIFQQYSLLPTLTAAENAALPLIAEGMTYDKAVRVGAAVLEQVGVGQLAARLPSQLSGGQQQRVAIARALVHKPRLIVCDEPTAALDEESGRKVMDILRSAAAEKSRAVLVVTHDNRIFSYADRLIRMNDGRISSIETKE
ncbi:MAG: ABC transporter ATP-binding protein [Alphaproteobacteria bacterium]|jgi:putative ABC transport system ATP-binding protein|nr:ABC transporter ATP-binding protein [Alphaproteobacteria bacterium]